jgi:hypothetical protein
MDIAAASGRVCREAFHNAEHPAVKHAAALLQVRGRAGGGRGLARCGH